MRFNEFNEGIDPSAKAAIKGMRELSGDQYYGLYKTMKDVAGHDGEKQTSPEGDTDHEVSDKPFAYAYTDEEKNMIKGVDPKAKQITSDKSEEVKEGMAEGLHPMVIADIEKLATLNPSDRYSAYSNIRGYFKADPELSKMASDLQGGYYEADMLRGKYKTDAAKAKYAELEPMHQAFIKQASNQDQGVAEAGNNYHANRTGFARPSGHRDDERHDLDTPRPTIYALKINGKIWQKDGNTVTFFTRERALAARNSILAKRPELEIGLVQRQD